MKMVPFQMIEFAASFTEAVVGEMVIQKALGERNPGLKSTILGAFAITIVVWVLNQQVLFSMAATISGILGIAVASCMIYRAKLHDALVLSAAYILMIYVVDFLTIVLFGVILKNNHMAVDVVGTYSIIRIYCLIFSKEVLCLVCIVLSRKILFNIHLHIGKMWMGVILSAILIYYLVRTTLTQTSKEMLFTWFLSLMLTLLGIYTVFQYFSMVRDREELKIAEKRNIQIAETYERVIQNYQNNRIFYHDLKNQYVIIRDYLKNKEYVKAEEYMEVLRGASEKTSLNDWTGISVLDILLDYKSKEAELLGIHMEIEAEPLTLQISESDLVALMGNILDNALEACQEVKEDRWIRVILKRRSGMNFIKVSNSCKEIVEMKKRGFLSTKADRTAHGYGVVSMKLIAEKYGGTIELSREGKSFTTFISFFSEDNI